MRNSIIIPIDYATLLMIEAKKCDLIKYSADIIGTGLEPDLEELEIQCYSRCYKTRQKLFQMLLLYDEIIIPIFNPEIEYDELKNAGKFLICSLGDYYSFNPMQEEEHFWYAEYLKPAILPYAKKKLKCYFPYLKKGVTFKSIISEIYDFSLGLICDLDSDTLYSIERNKKIFDIKHDRGYSITLSKEMKNVEFYKQVFGYIIDMYEDLCWQLDISLKNDSYIINSKYDLSKIGCDIYSKDIKTQHKAYEIIKLECSKTIGNLPHMNNLTDVLTLKEKRKTDIKNLREVLNNLETVIKEQGTENAVIKAANDVQKASKSLSIGNTLADVGKWLTMISVPISVAEVLYSLPPTSSLISVCGAGVCLCEQFYKNKGGWCEVVR